MRCPKCNQELNPHSERCPNCGTSARFAIPDGDTMTRVRRQISVMKRETEVSDVDLSDASFSPVLKFDKPEETVPEEVIEHNPANNFPDESFDPVDISDMIENEDDSEKKHRDLSASIRHLINNKEDDLLAEYYFKDGISDLERVRLAQSYADLERREADSRSESNVGELPGTRQSKPDQLPSAVERSASQMSVGSDGTDSQNGGEQEMSEAAKRLSQFPEEKGLDKLVSDIWDQYDSIRLKVRGFLRRNVFDRIKIVYDQFDAKTTEFTNGILDRAYYKKFGNLKRQRAEGNDEGYWLRLRIWIIVGIVAVLLLGGLITANVMTSSDINGKWIISTDDAGKPNIIMEFKRGGKASVSVRSEDGWHVHKQGRYKTNRKNGHDMLTIVYEDGDIKRLYYTVDGKAGTFINVDTNVQVVYYLK